MELTFQKGSFSLDRVTNGLASGLPEFPNGVESHEF